MQIRAPKSRVEGGISPLFSATNRKQSISKNFFLAPCSKTGILVKKRPKKGAPLPAQKVSTRRCIRDWLFFSHFDHFLVNFTYIIGYERIEKPQFLRNFFVICLQIIDFIKKVRVAVATR
jgi:hypothetical protein